MSVPVVRVIITRRLRPRLASQALRVRRAGIRNRDDGGLKRGKRRMIRSIVLSRRRRSIRRCWRVKRRKRRVSRGR